MKKMEGQTLNMVLSRQEKILSLFPEVNVDGKIDFHALEAILGELVEDNDERYQFNWKGKGAARKAANAMSYGTLLPLSTELSTSTKNIFIEGDNLETLKLLQKSYHKKVKMIYIDPPYNTGNEFIYPDRFQDNLDTYLRYTGQKDEEGRVKSTQMEVSGRYHTNWLNMMYSRLCLAKNLLKHDGVIFISIDDNELFNLLKICNEIFGEENHIGNFVWQSRKGGGSDSRTIVREHEYVVAFAKESPEISVSKDLIESEPLDRKDEIGAFRKGREMNKWGANSRRIDRPTMWYPIPGPNGEEVYPIRNDGSEGCWRFGKKSMSEFVARGDLLFDPRNDGTYIVYEKIRSTEPRTKPYRSILTGVGTTADGSKTVKELFDGAKVFDFPKPLDLLKSLIKIGTNSPDDIVLDFFAGSCTTAHAVLEYNKQNSKALSYICVQLPEGCDQDSEAKKMGFETISELGIERIRRSYQLLGLEPDFSVFKLDSSNFKRWDSSHNNLEETLFTSVDNIKIDRKDLDLVYEILIKYGLPLTVPIEKIEMSCGCFYSVGYGALIVVLKEGMLLEDVQAIGAYKKERKPATSSIVFSDKCFVDDSKKINFLEALKQYEFDEVRSL